VDTDVGALELPLYADSFTLGGRQSQVIVTGYTFGNSSRVLSSSAQIMFAGIIDGRDVLFLYGDKDKDHETSIYTGELPPDAVGAQSSDRVRVNVAPETGRTTISFLQGIEGLVTVIDSASQLVLFADTDTAGTFWAPAIAGAAEDPFRTFWGIGTNQSILVGGPYLVRDAAITGDSLALKGDLKEDVRLTIIAPKNIRSLSWNGYDLSPDFLASSKVSEFGGVFVADLKRKGESLAGIEVPELGGWKYKDSLPEIHEYDDGRWTLADHNTTNIPYKPYYGDGRVLYGCDYGL
jgi:hypothetical protein